MIHTPDFAEYIVTHLEDVNKTVSIGGMETYTYEELAKMCFAAAGKPPVIKYAPPFLFDRAGLCEQVQEKRQGSHYPLQQVDPFRVHGSRRMLWKP